MICYYHIFQCRLQDFFLCFEMASWNQFLFFSVVRQNYSLISENWINNAQAIKPLFMRLNEQNEKSGISLYYKSKHNNSLFLKL